MTASSPSAQTGAALPRLRLESVTRRFGGLVAVDDVSMEIEPGTVTALIGPNGAGKTTLFNMIAGAFHPTSGRISYGDTRIDRMPDFSVAQQGIARTFQNLEIFGNLSAVENVMVGRHRHGRTTMPEALLRLPTIWREEKQIRADAMRELEFVGLAEIAEFPAPALPFGHQRLIEIARALALEPTLLLLDEPAAGLNTSETVAMADSIRAIRNRNITVLLVEHDMHMVMGLDLVDTVIVLDQGRILATGTPMEVQQDAHVIEAYLG